MPPSWSRGYPIGQVPCSEQASPVRYGHRLYRLVPRAAEELVIQAVRERFIWPDYRYLQTATHSKFGSNWEANSTLD